MMGGRGLAAQSTGEAEAAFELLVLDGPARGGVLLVPSGQVTIGSDPRNAVRVEDPSVAPQHAELITDADGVLWIRDLTGRGLTLVNGESISAQVALADGHFVRLGPTELCVRERGHSGPYGTAIRQSGPQARVPDTGAHRAAPASGSNPIYDSGVTAHRAVGPPAGSGAAVLEPGTVVAGRYRVVDKLAEGGMGEVYRAEHVELGKPFALKVMKRQFGQDADFIERFKREAVAAGRIGQQNIVDVSDFGRMADGRFYFAMEFLDGQTLAQELRSQGALPLRRAIHVLVQMSRALKAAHARGIVHRDLKPENVILLQREGQPDFVKVVDFGVAKVAAPGSSGMTTAGMVVGTPQYMSPEQAAGLPLDGRTDIYSLGLIAFELLSGRPPFSEATPSLMMAAHIHKPAPPLYDPGTVDGVPARLGVLVSQMLAKAPEQRPPSMQEVMAELEEFADELPLSPTSGALRRGSQRVPVPTPRPSTPGVLPIPLVQEAQAPKRGGKGALIAVGLGVVILGAGAAGYAVWGRSPPEASTPSTQPPLAPIAQAPQAQVEIPAAVPAKGPVEPERVKLSLMSDPPNAEVYAGQTLLGRTPLMLDWNRGQRAELRFALDGYPPVERTLEPAGDTPLFVKLVRTPVRSKKRSETNDDLKDNPFK